MAPDGHQRRRNRAGRLFGNHRNAPYQDDTGRFYAIQRNIWTKREPCAGPIQPCGTMSAIQRRRPAIQTRRKVFSGCPADRRSTPLRRGDGVLDVPSARRCRAGNGLPRRCAPRSKCPWGTPRNDRMRGGGVSGSKKSKPRRGLLPLFRTACPAPLPARRWHHPGSRAGDARRGCSAPAGWRWPGHSPPPPM